MSFNIVCPCCNQSYPLQAGMNDVAARKAVEAAFKLTPYGDLLLNYVQLFKPPKRSMSMTRLAKILEELLTMIKSAQIESHGRTWPAPQAYWQQAIEAMLANRENLVLPLTSHGYLFKIIVGYANKAEAKGEKQAEQGRQYGRDEDQAVKPKKRERSVIPTHISQQLRSRDWAKK